MVNKALVNTFWLFVSIIMGCGSSLHSIGSEVLTVASTCYANNPNIKSLQIEDEIRIHQEYIKNEIKVLLLGAAEAGKSTIVKQIKIIHDDGYNDKERQMYRPIVNCNVVQSLVSIIKAMQLLSIQYSTETVAIEASVFITTVKDEWKDGTLYPEMVKQMMILWNDSGVQECFKRSNEYHLCDSAAYFLDALDRIALDDYVPTMQDVLRTRARTTGIVEVEFQHKNMNFRLVDVGGHRSERKKWIHCFDDVKAVVFVAALSDFDLNLIEDQITNRMVESLKLFQSICNNQWFTEASMIIFLNKWDVFETKISDPNGVPLTDVFPHYRGCLNSVPEASKFIRLEFESLNGNSEKDVYTHFTCATDTENVRSVFYVVTDMLVKEMLKFCGMY